jgi:DNA transformation protein
VAKDSFKDFVLDQLSELRDVSARAMFGGYGLYRRGAFFGIVYGDRLYFRTDGKTRAQYLEQGMSHFEPRPDQALKNYYEVPADVVDSREQLVVWAQAALGGEKR